MNYDSLPIMSAIALVAILTIIAVTSGAHGNNIINSLFFYSKQLSANAIPLSSPFSLTQTIAIPNVNGRIDHMAIDIRGQKLFVAELGNNSLDVVDLKSANASIALVLTIITDC
jgi:hypothetical protein